MKKILLMILEDQGGEHRMERKRNLPGVKERRTRASTDSGIEG